MRILFAFVLLVFGQAAAEAQPLREPEIAPVPAWVVPVALPAADPAQADRPTQILLADSQSRYAADQSEHFARVAMRIQTLQGLQQAGNIQLPWPPDQMDLIIHSVEIIRDGQTTNLLSRGQRSTVLRRENNIDGAVLDGALTAVMQPEGLAVGDILSISFTMRRRGSVLPHRGENFFGLPPVQPARRLSVRQLWPTDLPIRWRATGAFERARVRTTPAGTELTVTLEDAVAPEPVALLPPRFLLASALEVSQYRDWQELSAMLAPHYERASQLAPDSPLRAEIARIAALGPDPRIRTMAALRLVQDQVRYFALLMGNGNYLPASAEQTWARRFADCKGKTVLLVALLRELGIEAEPVLVNSETGDAIEGRLPMPHLFNHMIVRARIGGRSYWLDGTRTGDRDLDDLAFATFVHGLPITASGAALEPIPYQPPARPMFDTNITYDGSGGLNGRVPVRVETIARGEQAVAWRHFVSQIGREEFLRQLRENLTAIRGEQIHVSGADIRDDPEAGTFATIVTAHAQLDWDSVSQSSARRFRFEDETIRWNVDLDRPAGPFKDAPYAFPIPAYMATTETVILPNGGRGFAIDGESFERTIAGTRISRRLTLAGGRAVARSEFRRFEREVPAEAARAAVAEIARIAEHSAYLRAESLAALGGPLRRGGEERAGEEIAEPATAQEFVQRGFERLQARELDGADADFVSASEVDPGWSTPIANRAIVALQRDRIAEAEVLIERARALDANDFVVHQAQGIAHLARDRPIQAIVAFSRAIELEPGNIFSLNRRAFAYTQLGAFDDALADLGTILEREPRQTAAMVLKARIHAWRGNGEQALAAADAAIALEPNDPELLMSRAEILRGIGRTADAEAGFRAALAAIGTFEGLSADDAGQMRVAVLADMGDPLRAVAEIDSALARRPRDAQLLNARCWTLATANLELQRALADCERAVAAAPTNAAILDSRAFVRLRLGQIDAALADANAALEREPRLAAALYVRGIARLRKGEREAGERDLAAARRLVFDIDTVYRRYGVTP